MVEPIVLRFSLKVVSPVAILTGEELSLFDYYFNEKERKLFKLDFRLLIERLKKEGKLGDFLEFLKKRFDGTRESLEELYSYYREFSPFSDFLSLSVDLEHLPSRVKEIVKNPLNGLPYIPGSSIKGVIRTAILEAVITSCCLDFYASRLEKVRAMLKPFKGPVEKWEVDKKEVKKLKGELIKSAQRGLSEVFRDMERELLCRPVEGVDRKLFKKPPTKKELFRFIKVTDFLPEDGDVEVRLGLLQRRYRNGCKPKRKTDVTLEYINRGVFRGEVRIYSEYLEKFLSCRVKISEEKILSELEKRGKELLEKERKVFGRIYSYFLFKVPEGAVPVKLGFGGGALSKTFLDDRLRLVGNRKTGFRVIPHTISLINSKPAGWCFLTLEV